MLRRDLLKTGALSPWLLACRSAVPTSRRTIRVAAQVYLQMSPLYLAEELGYFREEGLDVEINAVKGSSQAIPLLSSGQMDAAFYALSPAVVNAITQGARVRFAAARQLIKMDCGEYGRIFGAPASFPQGLKSISQLRGKRIAVSNPDGITGFCCDAYLASAGLTRADVSVLRLAHPQDAAAMINGQVDAMISQGEESRLTGIANRIVLGPQLAEVLPDFAYSYIYFGQRLLDGDPADGVRFLRAFYRGAREFAKGSTPRFLDNYARDNNIDPAQARAVCRANTVFNGAIEPAQLQRFIDWCVANKHTDAPVAAATLIDPRFLAGAALPSDG